MNKNFVVSLTRDKSDPDRATVAFVVANAALGSDQETVVFLSTDAVHLSQKGDADGVAEEGFAPLAELIANFGEAGGKIYVGAPCVQQRGLDENNLVAGAVVVGGAKLVEFMAGGCPSVSY